MPSDSDIPVSTFSVTRTLPSGVTLQEAHEEWVDYTFYRGGGIPLAWSTARKGSQSKILHPIGVEEYLRECTVEKEKKIVQIYSMGKPSGLWKNTVVDGSHKGTVTFVKESDSSIVMNWTTTLAFKSLSSFWKKAVGDNMNELADNLVSYLSSPKILLTRTTHLPDVTVERAVAACRDFTMKSGGGLPLPKPWIRTPTAGDPHEEEGYLFDIIRFPTIMCERLTKVQVTDDTSGEIQYYASNPGFLSQYPALRHQATISFSKIAGRNDVLMVWKVHLRVRKDYTARVVRFATEFAINTLSRNTKVFLSSGQQQLEDVPLFRGAPAFLSVPRESFWGGVLTVKSSSGGGLKSWFQPWTWGRTEEWDDATHNEGAVWTEVTW